MSIQPVSFGFSAKSPKVSSVKNVSEPEKDTKTRVMKALPYVAGAVILAGSAYAFRGKIAKILKKHPDIKGKPLQETPSENPLQQADGLMVKNELEIKKQPAMASELPVEQPKQENLLNETQEMRTICTGFDNAGAPIYAEIEVSVNKGGAGSVFQDAFECVNLSDEKVISKIENIRSAEQHNIDRIINENTHDGRIDIPMMKKVANDYMLDVNRGENRFHQAADLLEQTHIRAHLRGDKTNRLGIYNLTDSVVTDPVLYKAYQNMPMEESAVRLKHLTEQNVKSENYAEGIDADGFFDKAFTRLVEKYQFKRYNEAHGFQC